MKQLPAREIHLDFHTSPLISGIATRFDRKEFQETLRKANVNSITIFAKCHHGYCYFPTEVSEQHPGMEKGRDFTNEMIEACHEIGVRAPIYITMGWSAHDAEEHPEWVMRNRDGSMQAYNYDLDASDDTPKPRCSWKNMCTAGGYRDHLCRLTEEICKRYRDVDGLFYDIVFWGDRCFCDSCRHGMEEEHLDVNSDEDAKKYFEEQKKKTISMLNDIIRKYHPEASIFYNSGGAEIDRPQWQPFCTHYEMEDLPTSWGGYDKMPIRAKYFARKGEYLGMTGKFHTDWGEFGGYKSKDALTFECANLLAYGAKISVGDQMHPLGFLDRDTYDLIGHAFGYVKKIEDYCFDTKETCDLAVMISTEPDVNEGTTKLLLDQHVDFGVITCPDDIKDYRYIIVPDRTNIDEDYAMAIDEFTDNGGHLILFGGAGLRKDKSGFAFRTNLRYEGRSEMDQDFLVVGDEVCDGMVRSPILFYTSSYRVSGGDRVLSRVQEPYFTRTYGHYCSHRNAPYRFDKELEAETVCDGNIIYIGHELCTNYMQYGVIQHRRYLENVLRFAGFDNCIKTNLQSCGRVRFVEQPQNDRYCVHLMYATPIQRGKVSVIEDIVETVNTDVELKIAKPIKEVVLVPQKEKIDFTQKDGKVGFHIDSFRGHQLIALNY